MVPLLLAGLQTEAVFFRTINPPRTIFDHVGEPVRGASVDGLSDDGRTLAGTWTDSGHSAYRWTEQAGAYTLPWDYKRMGYWHRAANALSADGLTVGGNAIWTQVGTPLYNLRKRTFIELHEVGLAKNSILVDAISARGDSFGGYTIKPHFDESGNPDPKQVAYIWRKGHGHRLIRAMRTVNGISSDGTRAVGPLMGPPWGPAVFTWPDSVRPLPLPKGSQSDAAHFAMSSDGRFVGGTASFPQADTTSRSHGVIWRDGKVSELLPSGTLLESISSDGKFAVGYNPRSHQGFLWRRGGDIWELQELVPELKTLAPAFSYFWPRRVSGQPNTITIAGSGSIVRFPRSRLVSPPRNGVPQRGTSI